MQNNLAEKQQNHVVDKPNILQDSIVFKDVKAVFKSEESVITDDVKIFLIENNSFKKRFVPWTTDTAAGANDFLNKFYKHFFIGFLGVIIGVCLALWLLL